MKKPTKQQRIDALEKSIADAIHEREVLRERHNDAWGKKTLAEVNLRTANEDLERCEQRLKRMEGDALTNFRLFAAQQARADALELVLRLVHKAEKPQDNATMVAPNANTMKPTTSDFYTADVAFGLTGRR